MSAFILSDKHISAIAHHFAPSALMIQDFANKLKRINIESVNYRYARHGKPTRCNRCNYQAQELSKYSLDDLAQLARCWIYQACEQSSIDFELMSSYLESCIKVDRSNSENSDLWAI